MTANPRRLRFASTLLLEQWLSRLRRDHGFGENAYTKAGVRKLIVRLHEELAV